MNDETPPPQHPIQVNNLRLAPHKRDGVWLIYTPDRKVWKRFDTFAEARRAAEDCTEFLCRRRPSDQVRPIRYRDLPPGVQRLAVAFDMCVARMYRRSVVIRYYRDNKGDVALFVQIRGAVLFSRLQHLKNVTGCSIEVVAQARGYPIIEMFATNDDRPTVDFDWQDKASACDYFWYKPKR